MAVEGNKNFYDGTDAEIASGTQVFSAEISANFATYGLTNAQATSYATLSGNYVSKWNIATNPTTRTKVSVGEKNDARTALKIAARDLASIINGIPTVTDPQKVALGLRVRDTHPTPSPVPGESPVLTIENAGGNIIKVKLRGEGLNKRGKPTGVKGAATYYWIGDETPSPNTPWQAFGNTGRTDFNMSFPLSLPQGTKVWVIASWYNGRGQFGPACQPVSTLLLGQQAPQQGNIMSIAA